MLHDFFKNNNVYFDSEEIFEDDIGYRILIEVPGFKKNDINIETVSNVLTVEAERKSNNLKLRKNRISKRYKVDLSKLSLDNLEASLEDGILNIFIPKDAKIAKRKIEIQ